MPLSAEQLELIATFKEPVIETRSGDRAYRTIIWAVVAADNVYVRSFMGDKGKWYQRATTDPEVALVLDDVRIAFRAVPDTDNTEAVSEAFRAKHGKGKSVDAMVRPEVLHTTLRLDPAG